jgi:hypothetical protein
MRPQPERIEFLVPLVVNPGGDQILCENLAFGQKRVIRI